MEKIKWGIIGPGTIANNFADGLKNSYSGQLVGIASKSDERRKSFGDKYSIHEDFRFDSYDDIVNSEHIDAIYISTPHTLHAEWTIKAAGKGKHVLCEKPGAVNYKEGQQVIDAVNAAGVFYMEGFMYRCHPQIPKLIELIKNKTIGDIISIESSFGFDMGKTIPEHRLFSKDLAGGAILDVGLYPISFSRLIAGAASGEKFLDPEFLNVDSKIGETEVDEITHANIKFKNGIKAKVSTAIRESMKNSAIIKGTNGKIELPDPWMPGRDGGPYHAKIIISKNNKEEIIDLKGPEHLFFFEAELASQSIAKEKTQAPYPAMTWDDTLSNLKALDQWRAKINYKLPQDDL
jgi:predicted dehydrogenase